MPLLQILIGEQETTAHECRVSFQRHDTGVSPLAIGVVGKFRWQST